MPELLDSARPFNDQQLDLLEASLPSSLIEWAISSPSTREIGNDHRVIRSLAALHAHSKALLAQIRLSDFKLAVMLGCDMHEQHEALRNYSPKERAGTAAGQLAVAKLLTRWYGLKRKDFSTLAVPHDALEFANVQVEGVQEAVCIAPQELRLSPFTARDVYLETRFEAEEAVGAHGPGALEPYMSFPELPISTL